MSSAVDSVRSVQELRSFVHQTLCDKENLIYEQFEMTESELVRRGRTCGLQFHLQGPRSVRLGAIWNSDHNVLYFYDAVGERYLKLRLECPLQPSAA